MDTWGVGWARKDGHITASHGAGPRPPALRLCRFPQHRSGRLADAAHAPSTRTAGIRRAGDLLVVDLVCGMTAKCVGALRPASADAARRSRIAAKATIVATGGLTRLYRRNSASANMGGDGYALALRAGAPLIDMEFVQFFPIGHLAPRLIGMDPIMWDPFRYKLGGQLLNRDMRRVHRALRRDARTASYVRHPRPRHLRDHQGGRGRPRLAARRRLSVVPASARKPNCARPSVR